jgi:hypothetical protein
LIDLTADVAQLATTPANELETGLLPFLFKIGVRALEFELHSPGTISLESAASGLPA